MLGLIAALAASLAQAAPAATERTDPPSKGELESVTVTGKRSPQEQLVCKVTSPIGSKIPTKTCIRKSESEQGTRDARRFAEDLQLKDSFYRAKEP